MSAGEADAPNADAVSAKRVRQNERLHGARCETCGSERVWALPTFSVGAGTAYRPLADDVYCGYCGHIGPPRY